MRFLETEFDGTVYLRSTNYDEEVRLLIKKLSSCPNFSVGDHDEEASIDGVIQNVRTCPNGTKIDDKLSH